MGDKLQELTDKINAKLKKASYFYVSNDPERATGLEDILENYHIVHIDKSQYLDDFKAQQLKYFCWQEELPAGSDVYRSSLKIIKSLEFLRYFDKNSADTNYFQTFKISPAFEISVKNLGGTLMNTTALLNREFEDKLSQYRHLSTLKISLPRTILTPLSEKTYEELAREFGPQFVVQFDRGHTGSGTVFVKTEAQYRDLTSAFPGREVRVSEFIEGQAYTINACVLRQGTVMGGLSRQITGIPELTPQAGGTVGNDWSDHSAFKNGLGELISEVKLIGDYMFSKGYRGLFGLDLIVLPNGQHKFIEINARQPASIPMYTRMQRLRGEIPLSLLHIAEFLEIDYELDIDKYIETALEEQQFSQIFVRALHDSVVNSEVRSGFYRLQGDNAAKNPVTQQVRPDTIFVDEERDIALLFYTDGYAIDHTDNRGIVLLTPVKGRVVKANEEIGRLQLRQSAFATTNSLKPWIIQSLRAVRDYQI